jgi:hypothetical protein
MGIHSLRRGIHKTNGYLSPALRRVTSRGLGRQILESMREPPEIAETSVIPAPNNCLRSGVRRDGIRLLVRLGTHENLARRVIAAFHGAAHTARAFRLRAAECASNVPSFVVKRARS